MTGRSSSTSDKRPLTISLGEILAGLSHALDITEGHPRGHTARSCVIGMRIAELIDLPGQDQSDLFYALLLKDAGSSSPDARRERGARVARGLGLSEATAAAIGTMDERWDGSGLPNRLRGEAIPLLGRIIGLSQLLEIFAHDRDAATALAVAERRSGEWFDPALVKAARALVRDGGFWRMLATDDPSALVTAVGPGERRGAAGSVAHAIVADDHRLDQIADAFASLIDAKSPYTSEHSRRVARLAVDIGVRLGFSKVDLVRLRRAALLHDIGKLGVPNRILDKPAALTRQEWSIVRQHPAFTLQILQAVPGFRDFAFDAACHHEKLDGSGYHRGYTAERLSPAARVLAVADIADALLADRPYRPSMEPADALRILRDDCDNGKLCPASGAAVADVIAGGAHLESAAPDAFAYAAAS